MGNEDVLARLPWLHHIAMALHIDSDYLHRMRQQWTRKSSRGRERWGLIIALAFAGVFAALLGLLMTRHGPDAITTPVALFYGGMILLGLGVAAYFAVALLTSPRIDLTVYPSAARTGDPIRIHWQIQGPVRRLQQLEITIHGDETCTHYVGSPGERKPMYVRRRFCSETILRTTDPHRMFRGQTEFQISRHWMHSVDIGGIGTHSDGAIEWAIEAHGTVERGPDLRVRVPLLILPYTFYPKSGGGDGS